MGLLFPLLVYHKVSTSPKHRHTLFFLDLMLAKHRLKDEEHGARLLETNRSLVLYKGDLGFFIS